MRRADLLVALLLVVLGGLVWSPILDSGPVTDDHHFLAIAANFAEDVRRDGVAELPRIFLRGAEEGRERGHRFYRPVVSITHTLQILSTGLAPRPLMIANVAIHLLVVLALYSVLRLLAGATPALAGALASLLLVAPSAVEPVAWICDRSDTLSLLFGLSALALRVWTPRLRPVSAALVFLALCSKEHSFVYPAMLLLIEWRDQPASGPWIARAARALRRGLPYLVAGLAWFLLRGSVVGFLETEYHDRGLGDHLRDPELLARYRDSALRLLAPVDERFASGPAGRATTAASIAFWVVSLGLGLARTSSRRRALPLHAAVLAGVTFLLGISFHGVDGMLMNGRLLYTPLAGLLLLAAGGLAVGGARRSGLVALAPLLLAAAWTPHLLDRERLWVDAYRGGQALTISARQVFSERTRPEGRRLVVLGYREPRFFNGSFDASSDIHLAARPPFHEPPFWISKIQGDLPDEAGADRVAFLDALEASGPATVFAVSTLDAEGREVLQPVHAGAVTAPGRIEILEPANGFAVDAVGSGDEEIVFRLAVRGLGSAALRLGVLTWGGLASRLDLDALLTEEGSDGAGRRLRFAVPRRAVRVEASDARPRPLGYFLEALDESGVVLARTEVRYLLVPPTVAGER